MGWTFPPVFDEILKFCIDAYVKYEIHIAAISRYSLSAQR